MFFLWAKSKWILRIAPAWAALFASFPLHGAIDPALNAALSNFVNQPKFARAMWGVQVLDASSGESLAAIHADKLMKPASVAKLFTAAAALDEFGPDYRIVTSLHAEKALFKGRVDGPLILYGRGDPALNSRLITNSASVQLLAQRLRRAGVRQVAGPLLVDTSFFDAIPYGTGWTWDDTHYGYGAKVCALNYEENIVRIEAAPAKEPNLRCLLRELDNPFPYRIDNFTRTGSPGEGLELLRAAAPERAALTVYGSLRLGAAPVIVRVPIESPAAAAGKALLAELKRASIQVNGGMKIRSRSPRSEDELAVDHLHELAAAESPPLRELLRIILKASDNTYAQALFLHTGRRSWRDSSWTIEEASAARVRELAARWGVESGAVRLDDGTGLSRSGLVTAEAVAALLFGMKDHPHWPTFRDALVEPGEGTLRQRLESLRGRFRGKTGSFRYVNTLAGYGVRSDGREILFALMLNNYAPEPTSPPGREEIDALARLLLEER